MPVPPSPNRPKVAVSSLAPGSPMNKTALGGAFASERMNDKYARENPTPEPRDMTMDEYEANAATGALNAMQAHKGALAGLSAEPTDEVEVSEPDLASLDPVGQMTAFVKAAPTDMAKFAGGTVRDDEGGGYQFEFLPDGGIKIIAGPKNVGGVIAPTAPRYAEVVKRLQDVISTHLKSQGA